MQKVLDDIAQNGIPADALNSALDQQEEAQQFTREEVFVGFAYAGDPLACVGREDVITGLRSDQTYFKSLAAEWRDSPYHTGCSAHTSRPRTDAGSGHGYRGS